MNRKKILFICGSQNQTSQLHQVASALPECDTWFTPYYCSPPERWLTGLGLAERTIGGRRIRARCFAYLAQNRLALDIDGKRGGYDLVVTCSDVVIPDNVRGTPLLAVQEGILDPDGFFWHFVRRFPDSLPRWLCGTAATGLSGAYLRFCVASEGYRDLFIARGAPAERLVVTGIPNFDDCESFRANDFPHRGYVLVCTSDTRETFKFDRRRRFIERAVQIARGRPLFFKLHPNENLARSRREIQRAAPHAKIFCDGPTEAMIANGDVLITQYSSTVFVGLALGKEVHSFHPIEELRRLMPVQNRCAARKIADVCRKLLYAPELAARSPQRRSRVSVR